MSKEVNGYIPTKDDIKLLKNIERKLLDKDLDLLDELRELIFKIEENRDNNFSFSKEYKRIYWYNESSSFTYELKRVDENEFFISKIVHLGLFGLDGDTQRKIKKVGETIEILDHENLTTRKYSNTLFYKKNIEHK